MTDFEDYITLDDDVLRLDLRPGDVIVLLVKRKLSLADQAAIRGQLATVFPANKVLILDEGTSLAIVGPAYD